MNKNKERIAVTLMLLATVVTIVGVFGIESFRRKQFYTVELIARSPLNGNWTSRGKDGIWHPRKIYAPYGKEVKLYIRNIETVSHGFALPDFNRTDLCDIAKQVVEEKKHSVYSRNRFFYRHHSCFLGCI